jgi:hypothetical protein
MASSSGETKKPQTAQVSCTCGLRTPAEGAQLSLKFVATKAGLRPVVIDAADDAVVFVAEWMLKEILEASTDKPAIPGKRSLISLAGRTPCGMELEDWRRVFGRTPYPREIDTDADAWAEYCRNNMLG